MGFFDNISKNVQNIGQTTMARTKEFADISKLSNQIAENKSRITQLYIEIGTEYCKMVGDNSELPMFHLVEEIRRMTAQNAEWENKIQELKGYTKCTFCGKYILKETAYCTFCGQRVIPDDVIQCPKCNAFVKIDQQFCMKCGTKIDIAPEEPPEDVQEKPPVQCKVCGSLVPWGNIYCMTCGTKVEEEQIEQADMIEEDSLELEQE